MSTAAQKRRYYRADPDKHRTLARTYYRAHSASVLTKKAAWNAANPVIAAQRCKAFRAAHPNYFREYGQRKRLRDAWLKWSITCAASRRAREERESTT